MSSSDSENDCFGNVAKELQKMKNKFNSENVVSSSFLDDSFELDKTPQENDIGAKSAPGTFASDSQDTQPSVSNKAHVSGSNPPQSRSKRRTRASAANDTCSAEIEEMQPPRTRRRGNTDTEPDAAPPRRRGRGRSVRQRGGTTRRSRGRAPRTESPPVYVIGDAEDVYDGSRGQSLFSNQPKLPGDVLVIDENDPLDENEELSIKVYWQSCEFFRFHIRKYQKLTQIFDYFAQKKNVSRDNLLFTYEDKILNPDDTPDKIGYNIVNFIDGGIVNQSISQMVTRDEEKIKDGIKLKFQCQNVKKPFEITIRATDKLSMAMTRCAEHFELPLSRLKFEFDGDAISGHNTASELELEGGECIDVKMMR